MTRIKVAHVITGLGPGGAEAMLVKLLQGMDREKFPSIVVSLGERGDLANSIEALGINVRSMGMSHRFPSPLVLLRLRKLLIEERVTLVQGWMYHGNLTSTLAMLGSGSCLPVLWNIRQSLDDLPLLRTSTKLVVRVGALLSRLPRKVIYNSQRGAEQHATIGYDTKQAITIPNGFDVSLFRPSPAARASIRKELNVGDSQVLIGQVGRFHPSKDHRNFFQAAALVAARFPEVRFVIAGSGLEASNKKLSDLIAQFNIQDRVHLLGVRTDIPQINAALDIASLSSWSEGFPNVVGEAMSCGIPCVVTDVGDAAAIVADKRLVVPRGDPVSLAAAWTRLVLAGDAERRAVGAAARARVVESFSLGSIANDYEKLYIQVAQDIDILPPGRVN